jgi:hypothetical protein
MAKRIWLCQRKKKVYCCSGRPNTCNNLKLLQAEDSYFHDEALIEATDRINAILAEVRDSAPPGEHLAMIDTTKGLLLAWAEAIEPPDDLSPYVTADSPEEDIEDALGLEDEPALKTGA